ncbi:MAG: glutathione S-transferase family protein [Pseudomonadota bacterium]
MTTDTPFLILYGVPFSQPVRAVMWLLLHQREPFKMVLTNPGSKGDTGSRHPSFLAKNSAGTIPTIEEPESGFTLGEAHAILCYLCNSRGWDALYPAAPQARAKVDGYLHYHHRNLRDASVGLVAPKIRKDLDIPAAVQEAAQRTLQQALKTLDSGWLNNHAFLAGPDVTIADLGAYVEIGQLQSQFTNLMDFTPFPNVSRWLTAMQAVPGHDTVHRVLAELGDISTNAPSMDVIKNANKRALQALKEALSEFV